MNEIQKRVHFQMKTNVIPLDSMQKNGLKMIQNQNYQYFNHFYTAYDKR